RTQFELRADRERGHTGAPILSRDMHTIDVRVENAGDDAQDFGDFAGGDVFAFPAESVAYAIDEIEIAVFVAAHQVAGAKPAVAFFEHVIEDLLFGIFFLRVAFEAATRLIDDLA